MKKLVRKALQKLFIWAFEIKLEKTEKGGAITAYDFKTSEG